MKESEVIKPFFRQLSINQKRVIFLVMGCLLVASMGLSISHRLKIKRISKSQSIENISQIIKEFLDEMPQPSANALNQINQIKKALIQLEMTHHKPVMNANDSLEFQKIVAELKKRGIDIQ